MWTSKIALAWIAASLLAYPAAAQERIAPDTSGILIAIDDPLVVGEMDRANAVLVIGDEARIDGVVERQLIVINGTAWVGGTVESNVVVVNGKLYVGNSGHIAGNVLLYGGGLVDRAPGARIDGQIRRERGVSFSAPAAWFLWIAVTLLLLLSGLAFQFLASRQLEEAGRLIRAETGRVLIAALLLVLALPVAAIFAFTSGIGIPIALFVLLIVVPALTFVGYLTAGAAFGQWACRGRAGASFGPYARVAIGLLLLQLLTLVPVLGGFVALVGAQIGAGMLAYRMWRNRRGGSVALPVGQTA
jgi:hypothetical protein